MNTRIEDMETSLRKYTDAGATPENGYSPSGTDAKSLRNFLIALEKHVLKGQKVGCPIVMPSVDRSILLKWAGEDWDCYADVNLSTLETSHHVVDDSDVLENEIYSLGESAKEWKIFSERVKEWATA